MEVLWCIAVDSYGTSGMCMCSYMQRGMGLKCGLQCEKSSVNKDQMLSG